MDDNTRPVRAFAASCHFRFRNCLFSFGVVFV